MMDLLDGLGEGSIAYRTHFNTVTKENNVLKQKIESLERENRLLKRSVFELTNRLSYLKWQVGGGLDPLIYDEQVTHSLTPATNGSATSINNNGTAMSSAPTIVNGVQKSGTGVVVKLDQKHIHIHQQSDKSDKVSEGTSEFKTIEGIGHYKSLGHIPGHGNNRAIYASRSAFTSLNTDTTMARPSSCSSSIGNADAFRARPVTPTQFVPGKLELSALSSPHSSEIAAHNSMRTGVTSVTATSLASQSKFSVMDRGQASPLHPKTSRTLKAQAETGVNIYAALDFNEYTTPSPGQLGEFRCELELKEHSGAVYSLAWSRHGTLLASGSLDKKVAVRKAIVGTDNEGKSSLLLGHEQLVSDVKWMCDNETVISSSFDQTVRVWDHVNKRDVVTYRLDGFAICIENHTTNPHLFFSGTSKAGIYIFDTRVSPDSPANAVKIINGEGKEKINTVHSLTDPDLDNYIYTGDSKGMIRLWDIRYPKKLDGYDVLNEDAGRPITHITASPKLAIGKIGRLLAVNSYDNVLRIYDSYNQTNLLSQRIQTEKTHPEVEQQYPINPGFELTASVKGHRNKNWPIKSSFYSGAIVDSFVGASTKKHSSTLLLATGSASHSCYVFSLNVDMGTRNSDSPSNLHSTSITENPLDNKGSATGMAESSLDIIQRTAVPGMTMNDPTTVAHTKTSRFAKIEGHTGRVYSCQFNPNEQMPVLATASADSTVRVWAMF